MYKLKKGVELPYEFKIKVNPEQSKALQEYYHSIGKSTLGLSSEIKYLDFPYVYKRAFISAVSDTLENKEKFEKHEYKQIDFQDYFETSFPEKWCIQVTEDNYEELNEWMQEHKNNYTAYTRLWKVNKESKNLYFISESGDDYPGHSYIYPKHAQEKGYTLITTEQFREQFGAKKEKVLQGLEFKAKDFMQSDERTTERTFDNIIDEMEHNIEVLKKQIEQKDSIITDNKKVIATLDAENKKLKSDVSQLKTETWIQRSEIERFRTYVELLKDEYFIKIKKLSKENKKLKKQIKMLSLR